ncbi:MAG: sodium:solute symporter [Clostridia bacterium]|nr:sodium:solute symporter [Clostridia bacterium]
MKLAILIGYFAVLAAVALLVRQKSEDASSFLAADRGVGSWMSALVFGTTYFSAVIFVGYAGKVGWGFGLSALWVVVGNALLGAFLCWRVLARRTWVMTSALGVLTLPQFLRRRYESPALGLAAAIVVFVFLIPYSASVFMGLSYLFEQIMGIPYVVAIVLMAVITAGYMAAGGYLAVSLANAIQAAVMVVGCALLVGRCLADPAVGGVVTGMQRLAAIDPRLVAPVGPGGLLPLLSLVLITSLGPWGMPQMILPFCACRNPRSIAQATVICTVFCLLIGFSAYFTGAFSRLFFESMPAVGGKPAADLIMPLIIDRILPGAGGALIVVLVLAASMSTLATLVLVSSSAIAMDIVEVYWPEKVKGKRGVFLMRFLCVLFVGVSLVIAITRPAIILSLMALSWGAVAGFFMASYLYGLYWPRATRAGAWAASLTGITLAVGLSLYFRLDPGVVPLAGVAGILAPLLILPVVSWLSKPCADAQQIFARAASYGEGAGS